MDLEDSGVLRALRDDDVVHRLVELHRGLHALLERLAPDCVAMEAGFGARHARAALILGHARGAALLTVGLAGLPVKEYPPAMVKKAVTGSGAADKEQVRRMVGHLVGRPVGPSADEADAVAVALCHLQLSGFLARVEGVGLPKARRSPSVAAAWSAHARESGSPRRRT
jgi:crossover junction endodeoxyribonuclease RuvC